ncbi:zinc ribbon domain-containing protein [Streptomyces sp. NPDC059744]|uniref:zinc ribbon domain-containing protein n=1 Tax=Streptomyces sp. NPDC059744 TaxID=3346929 RepID=UPI003653C5E8
MFTEAAGFWGIPARSREGLTSPQETFHCVDCGHSAHADTVGALNVLRVGPGRPVATPTRLSEKPRPFKAGRSRLLPGVDGGRQ